MFFAHSTLDAMAEPFTSISLGHIGNQRTQAHEAIQYLINHDEVGDAIPPKHTIDAHRILFRIPGTSKRIRLTLEPFPQQRNNFKEFRLRLDITEDGSHLKIIKDFGDLVSRPEELYPLKDNKKHLLNLVIHDENGTDDIKITLTEQM